MDGTNPAFGVAAANNYLQHEAWFEVSRGNEEKQTANLKGSRPYIDIINSYGRLRRLYTDTGKYKDISDGGDTT